MHITRTNFNLDDFCIYYRVGRTDNKTYSQVARTSVGGGRVQCRFPLPAVQSEMNDTQITDDVSVVVITSVIGGAIHLTLKAHMIHCYDICQRKCVS